MKPGVSHKKRIGSSKASHSCMKRAALSALAASMAPARCSGLLAITPTGRPSRRTSAVTMPGANAGRSSSTDPSSASSSIARRARRRPAADRPARTSRSSSWSAQSTRATSPWKYDRYCWATSTASVSSAQRTSTTPLGTCTDTGPTSSGRNTPSPPPSIMAGPPMPMLASGVAMMTSQQPSSAALPAKQRPETTPTSGTSPLSAPKRAKASVSRPVTTAMSVSPGRPPPPSAKSTTGRRSRSTRAEEAVLLAVVHLTLGAGQHGVVVGQDGARAAQRRRGRR